jgi:hypothetical protein
MDNTLTKIIFRIRLFFYDLIKSFRPDINNENKDYFYNDESVIVIEDSETITYLFETEPIT